MPGRGASVGLVLAAASLFGTIGTARVLGPPSSSASVGAARLALAAILLLVVAALAGAVRGVPALLRRPATWVAGLAQVAFQVSFLSAVERTGVAIGTLVAIGSAPIITGVVTRHRSRLWAGATALAILGLALLVMGGDSTGRVATAGVLLALAGGVSYAAYIVATKHVVAVGSDDVAVVTTTFGVAAAVLSPALVTTDLGWLGTVPGAVMVAYLAVVATVAAYLMFTAGLRGIPAATANTLGLAEPMVAALLGVWLLAERLAPPGWLGVALVLVALVLLGRSTGARIPAAESAA
jgi:drug/metabolite transporter, DME family